MSNWHEQRLENDSLSVGVHVSYRLHDKDTYPSADFLLLDVDSHITRTAPEASGQRHAGVNAVNPVTSILVQAKCRNVQYSHTGRHQYLDLLADAISQAGIEPHNEQNGRGTFVRWSSRQWPLQNRPNCLRDDRSDRASA